MVVWKGIVIVNPSCVNYLACPANAISNNRCRNFCIAIFFLFHFLSDSSIFSYVRLSNGCVGYAHRTVAFAYCATHTHTWIYFYSNFVFHLFFFFSLFFVSLYSRSLLLKYVMHIVFHALDGGGGFVSRRIPFHAVSLTVLPSVAAMSISQNVEEDTRATHYCLWRRKIMRWAIQSRKGTKKKKKENGEERCVCCMQHENGMRCADRQRYAMQRRGKRLMRKA